jgi:hypothetical protein
MIGFTIGDLYMPFKDGTKSGGRKKGTPNKRTVLDREEAKEAAKRIAAAAGLKIEDIDAHTLLQLFYRCEEFSPRFRKECAAEALKYEKPALSSMDSRSTEQVQYVVEMPPPVNDLEEWNRLYMSGEARIGDDGSGRKQLIADAQDKGKLDS